MSRKGNKNRNRGAQAVEGKDPIQQEKQGQEAGAETTANGDVGNIEETTLNTAEGTNDGGALMDEIAADDAANLAGEEGVEGAGAPASPDEGQDPAAAGEVGEPAPVTTPPAETPPANTEDAPQPPTVNEGSGDEASKETVTTEKTAGGEPPVTPTEPTPVVTPTAGEEGGSENSNEGGEGGVEVDPLEELFKFQTFDKTEMLAARDFVTRINRYIEKMDPEKYIAPKDAAFEQRALYNAYLVALTGSAKLARWAIPYLLDKFYVHRQGVFSAQRINHCLSLVNLTKDKLTLLTGLNNLFLSTCEPEGRKQNLKRVNLRQLTTQISTVWGHSRYGINLLEGYNLGSI